MRVQNQSDAEPIKNEESDETSKTGKKESKCISKLLNLIGLAVEKEERRDQDGAEKAWDRCVNRISYKRRCRDMDVLEVEFKDDALMLPLHKVVRANAPFRVVEALVKAKPDVCQMPHEVDSLYPLHIACSQDPKDSTPQSRQCVEKKINLLMDTFPAAIIRKGECNVTALHLLLEHDPSIEIVKKMIRLANEQIVLSEEQSILAQLDNELRCPLNVALEYGASNDVISFLYHLYPEGATIQTVYGLTGLHLAVKYKHYRFIKKFSKKFPELVKVQTDIGEDGQRTSLHILFDYDQKESMATTLRMCRHLLMPFVRQVKANPTELKNLLEGMKDANGESIIAFGKRKLREKRTHKGVVTALEEAAKGDIQKLDRKAYYAMMNIMERKKGRRGGARTDHLPSSSSDSDSDSEESIRQREASDPEEEPYLSDSDLDSETETEQTSRTRRQQQETESSDKDISKSQEQNGRKRNLDSMSIPRKNAKMIQQQPKIKNEISDSLGLL